MSQLEFLSVPNYIKRIEKVVQKGKFFSRKRDMIMVIKNSFPF